MTDTQELAMKAEKIIEDYTNGYYTNAREAILEGVKLGLDAATKIYSQPYKKFIKCN